MSDVNVYHCIRCSNYWTHNGPQGNRAINRFCPDCIAYLPKAIA
jgi:hypothetical protein